MTKKNSLKETYEVVGSLKRNGIAVNVHKPKTMRDLPLELIGHCFSQGFDHYGFCSKSSWFSGNPDYGSFDALVTYHQYHKTVDCYVTAILVRPFTEDAFNAYGDIIEKRLGANLTKRLRDIFDSRVYDEALAQ